MLDEHVELLERSVIEEQFEALAGRQLAALVLGIDARLAATEPRIFAAFLKRFQNVFHDLLRPGLSAISTFAVAGGNPPFSVAPMGGSGTHCLGGARG